MTDTGSASQKRLWSVAVAIAATIVFAAIGLAPVSAVQLGNADCIACHGTYHAPNEPINCDLCHIPLADPMGYTGIADGIPGLDHVGQASVNDCVWCHNTEWPGVFLRQHTEAGLESLHVTTTPCIECHSDSLIDEHTDCAVCHSSTSADVSAAIDGGDTSCDACHDVVTAHDYHDGIALAECASCHGSDPLDIHADCLTCHSGPTPLGSTCLTCHSGFDQPHGLVLFDGPFNPGYAPLTNDPVGDGFPGYLRWRTNSPGGQAWSADGSTSPHGNYATTTNKCAVCHSVHRADAAGTVLTAWAGASVESSCSFCHSDSATFTPVRVLTMADGTIDPHTTCTGRCHVASPHGAGASEYPVLRSALLQARADDNIAADWGAPGVAMFEAGSADGRVLGTGYLCSDGGGCHAGASFAVHEAGFVPNGTAGVTGHRVLATATADWNSANEFDADFTGQIAWNSANSCQACHDAETYWGGPAFPHNYVNSLGNAVAKSTTSSFIWLTQAADAGAARELVEGYRSAPAPQNREPLTRDGLCLKCHVSAGGVSGVGVTY